MVSVSDGGVMDGEGKPRDGLAKWKEEEKSRISISMFDMLIKSKSQWNPLFQTLQEVSVYFSEYILAKSKARIWSFSLKK